METARINIVVPKDVHTEARIHSIRSDMTMAQVVTEALRVFLGHKQLEKAVQGSRSPDPNEWPESGRFRKDNKRF